MPDPDMEKDGLQVKRFTAWICAGSNIGDKCLNCRNGLSDLEKNGNARITARSRFYKTEPTDYLDQDWFVNVVVRIETTLSPEALLSVLKQIENKHGRKMNEIRFGPRILDLDILFYEDRILDTPGLTIPHPRMHERRFVLQPICDIDSELVHPVLNEQMRDLLENLDKETQKVMALSCSN